jgi:hypothetical protein
MSERPTVKIAEANHAEIVKLCGHYGLTVSALTDALLEYATAGIPRVDEAIAEHNVRASKAASERRRRESEPGPNVVE